MDEKPHTPAAYSDHDLLIRLDTRMEGLTKEVRDSNTSLREDLNTLKEKKLDISDFLVFKSELQRDTDKSNDAFTKGLSEHSKTLSAILRYMYISLGVVLCMQFAIPVILKLYFHI